jgi:hypothetical protein
MASRSQKTPRKVSEKDREFDNLLRSAFRALNAEKKRPVLIKTSVNKRNTKVQ